MFSNWFSLALVTMAALMPCTALAVDDEVVKAITLAPQQYADDAAASATADELEKQFPAEGRPEAVRMLIHILRHTDMGPQAGWFGPSANRYDWKKFCFQQGWDPDAVQSLKPDQFTGGDEFFKRLDRDKDGEIKPDDLDWSDGNPWVRQANLVGRLFRRINRRGDGRLTRDDLSKFFDRVADGKDHINLSDLRDALLALGPASSGDDPSREVLVRGLIAGEIGSIHEGPKLDEPAPDFTLATPDGQKTYRLSELIGPKPVVLVFGNFTCGPFRAFYPEVETLYERYGDQATFLMVYVREAHPTDGWAMESNTKAGVATAQPKSLEERIAVCDLFREKLKPAVPVVVDDVNDAVGHAYSGMPARLYLIDTKGLVAYKSGRGPFGFKVGELEQALVMNLLEAESK